MRLAERKKGVHRAGTVKLYHERESHNKRERVRRPDKISRREGGNAEDAFTETPATGGVADQFLKGTALRLYPPGKEKNLRKKKRAKGGRGRYRVDWGVPQLFWKYSRTIKK